MWCNQMDSAAEVRDSGLGAILHQTQSEILKKILLMVNVVHLNGQRDLENNKQLINYRQFSEIRSKYIQMRTQELSADMVRQKKGNTDARHFEQKELKKIVVQ